MILHQLQPSFNNGEISPLLYDRTDYNKFVSSLKSGKNMFVHPQGGCSNRAGTIMLSQAKDEKVRLIPFEFSNTETYTIEFGNGYCRFFTSDGQVIDESGLPYEIDSPFTTSDLDKIKFCQSGDVMYIAWGGKPKTLTRYGHTNWLFLDYENENGPVTVGDGEITLSCTYKDETSNFLIQSTRDLFSSNDVGRLVKVEKIFDSLSIYGNISNTSYTSNNYLGGRSYLFKTTGTWTGFITLQYSYDKIDWKDERSFSSVNDTNYSFSGEFDDDIVWIRLKGNVTSGTAYVNVTVSKEKYPVFFKITSFVDASNVYGEYIGEIADIKEAFGTDGGSSEITSIIPYMTSNTTPSGTMYSPDIGQYAYLVTQDSDSADSRRIFRYGAERSFGYIPGYYFYLKNITFWYRPYRSSWNFTNMFSKFEVYGKLRDDTYVKLDYVYSILQRSGAYNEKVSLSFSSSPLIKEIKFVFIVNREPAYETVLGTQFYFVEAKGIQSSGETTEQYFTEWSLGLWKEGTYPTDVDLYQDRITWTTNNQIDATKISNYTDFNVSTSVTQDDAISIIIKDKKINKLNTIVASNKLVAFTDSGNFVHSNDTFTPNTATFHKQGSTGGASVKPLVVRDDIIYVHPMRQAISDYSYNFETDGYAGKDITILATHLFQGDKIKEMYYQQEPYSIIWVLLESGKVLACTYLRQQEVIAWTPMDFGGEVQSICVLSDGTSQELYLAVKRNNGTFVEKMPNRLMDAPIEDRFFVDCGRTYKGEPISTVQGLDWLEGETVSVLADGNCILDKVVTNGEITLDTPASTITVGIPFESVLETLTFDVGGNDGSVLNRKKRVVAVSIKYIASRGGLASVNGNREINLIEHQRRTDKGKQELKTGFYREILPSRHDESANVKIRQILPLPVTITSVIPEIEYEQ